MLASSPRLLRTLEVLLLLAVFGTILLEWMAHSGRVARLSYTVMVPVLAGILAFLPSGEDPEPGPVPVWQHRLGSLLLLGAAGLLAIGSLGVVFTVSLFAFPVAVTGLIMTWFGWTAIRRRIWAFLLLFLMVPVPGPILDRVHPQLTHASGVVATFVVKPFDPEASWRAADLTFRGWVLVVEEACSGTGTLLAYLVLAMFLAGLFQPRWLVTFLLFALAIPLTLLVNGVRIGATAILLDNLGPQAAEGLAHELLGQGLLIGSIGLLALAVGLLSRKPQEVAA